MSGWSSTELSHYASSSDAEEILDYASDENGNNEKCPICLVSPFTYVTTLCNHQFCLRCIIKMWESENYEIGIKSCRKSRLFFLRRRRRMGSACLSNLPRSRYDSNLDFYRRPDSSRNAELQLALPKQSRNASKCPVSPDVGRQLPRLPARFYPADAVFIDTVYH